MWRAQNNRRVRAIRWTVKVMFTAQRGRGCYGWVRKQGMSQADKKMKEPKTGWCDRCYRRGSSYESFRLGQGLAGVFFPCWAGWRLGLSRRHRHGHGDGLTLVSWAFWAHIRCWLACDYCGTWWIGAWEHPAAWERVKSLVKLQTYMLNSAQHAQFPFPNSNFSGKWNTASDWWNSTFRFENLRIVDSVVLFPVIICCQHLCSLESWTTVSTSVLTRTSNQSGKGVSCQSCYSISTYFYFVKWRSKPELIWKTTTHT